jgi:hypothetical protein
MTRRHIAVEDVRQVIGCELNKRPDAPTIDDLAPLVLSVTRSERELAVAFPASAREQVEAFAAAERVCCAGIDWRVEAGSRATLRIGADELVIDAISQMFPTQRIEIAQ